MYKKPFVLTCHSLEPLRPWKQDQLGEAYTLSSWLEKIGIESADKIIAVSYTMKKDILSLFNIPEERIEIIHNGIDPDKWQYTPLTDELRHRVGIKNEYIFFVGRPTKQKGMEYLIQASDYLPKDIQIVMAATGSDTKEYEEELEKMVEPRKNIIWIRELLPVTEYIQLYSSATVFVCPSVYEPFGITNLEAMACKTPVVASAVGGIKEVVVNEETGLLVEPKDVSQLKEAVIRILKDKKLRNKFGENSRKRIEQCFTWKSIAQKTKNLYEGLVG
jgi:glycogen synthase